MLVADFGEISDYLPTAPHLFSVSPSAFMSVHQRLNSALHCRRHLSGGVGCFDGIDKIDKIDKIDGIDCGPC